ncbi:hypothetical protein B0H14DRAFT_3509864 [Mycena olivaceomarginata]|nr:hypothetical protein B0H14DRAFT_3509864 [Mycena olivaceomarginata]
MKVTLGQSALIVLEEGLQRPLPFPSIQVLPQHHQGRMRRLIPCHRSLGLLIQRCQLVCKTHVVLHASASAAVPTRSRYLCRKTVSLTVTSAASAAGALTTSDDSHSLILDTVTPRMGWASAARTRASSSRALMFTSPGKNLCWTSIYATILQRSLLVPSIIARHCPSVGCKPVAATSEPSTCLRAIPIVIDPLLLGLAAPSDVPKQDNPGLLPLPLCHPDETFESWQARLPLHLRRHPGETFDHWQARHPLQICLPCVLLPPGTALDTPPISNPAHLPCSIPNFRQSPPMPTVAARVLQGLLAVYTPAAPVAPLLATPVVQPVVQQPVVTSPVSLPVSAPITPRVAMPVPSSPPSITPPPLVLPSSRPLMNPIPPPKKAPARKEPAKTPSTAQTAVKKTAAVSAAKVAAVRSPKKRGRPQKELLPDIMNTMVDAASASTSETAAAAGDLPIPLHVYSSSNNNCACVQQAAAEAEATKAAEEAGAHTKKLAKGSVKATVDGATVVTLLPAKRVCKPAMLPDGSRLQPKTTEPKLDASEKVLLACVAANSKKRKTSTTAEVLISQ